MIIQHRRRIPSMTPLNIMKGFALWAAGVMCLGIFCLMVYLVKDLKDITDQTHATLVQSQRTMQQLNATLTDIRRTIEIAGGTLNVMRDTMRNEQVTIKAANDQTITTMRGIDDLVSKANNLVADSDHEVAAMSTDIHNTLGAAQQTILATNQTILDVDKQANNPAISDALAHVDGTMNNLQDTSKQLDDVAKYYEKRLTTPKGFVSTLFHGLIKLIEPGASVATAIK